MKKFLLFLLLLAFLSPCAVAADGDVTIIGTLRNSWFSMNLNDLSITELGTIPNSYYIRGGTKVGDEYRCFFYGNPWNNEYVSTPADNPGSDYTIINPSTPYNITQLAYSPVNGQMWAYSSQEGRTRPVDVETGNFLGFGNTAYSAQGLCFDTQGNLYNVHIGVLNRINTETGEEIPLVNTGYTSNTSSKMTLIYDSYHDVFYWSVYNGANSTLIYKLNANNGTYEVLGEITTRLYDFVDIHVESSIPADLNITPNPLAMGPRPVGAWMHGEALTLTNTTTVPILVNTFDFANSSFFVMDEYAENPTLPFMITPGQSKEVYVTTNQEATIPSGNVSGNFVALYGTRNASMSEINAVAYIPVAPDVWEVPTTVSTFPYTSTESASLIYDNYFLPGDNQDGPDAVYKLVLDGDKLLSASVIGDNPKVAVYSEDFYGEPGPGTENYYTGEIQEGSFFEGFESGDFSASEWTNDASYPWTITSGAYEGVFCAQSGNVGVNSSESGITLTYGVPEDCNINFYWKASCEGFSFDYPKFYIDGNLMTATSGWSSFEWTLAQYPVTAGIHEFKWAYSKDGSVGSASDCIWVDNISFGEIPTRGIGDNPINEMLLVAGTYYLVASSTSSNFTVNIDAVAPPLPEAPICVEPLDGTTGITTPINLKWELGRYTTEYQLVMGTTYPPTDVVVDWTNELATNYVTGVLLNNKSYFWRVNERNSSGTTAGTVWGFTTTLNIPQTLTAADYNLYLGESAVLNWTGVNDRSYRGYNVYQDGVKINSSLVTTTSYTVNGLAYNMDGYNFNVTAVYDEGESDMSNAITVYMSGNGSVSGTVYELDGVATVAGATVTISGLDEYDVPQSFNYTTNDNGVFSGDILAGVYSGIANKTGYQQASHDFPFHISYNGNTPNINFTLVENYTPVGEVVAEEVDDNMVKVYWSWDMMSVLVEDFETGGFEANPWDNTISSYPWAISTNNPYEGTYCMKSTCEGVNSGSSAIQITVNVPYNGLMSFYQMISSEQNYDNGHFYIDGVEKATVSGTSAWTYKEFNVTEGEHTYKWEYTKDSSVSSNADNYSIDYVTFYQQPEPWPGEGWIFYDDGTNIDAVGLTAGGSFYWGIMFPTATLQQYGNFSLTKVAYFDYSANTGTILIYEGGETVPGTLIHSQPYTATGSGAYIEFDLTSALPINNTQNLWIVMNNNDGQYVASASADGGDPNGRWISLDGATWDDIVALGLSYTWNLRGFITNARGQVVALANDNTITGITYQGQSTPGGVLTTDPEAKTTVTNFGMDRGYDRSFNSFTLYRTDCYNEDYSEENINLVASHITDTVYMDMSWADTEAGVYKWGVSTSYEGNRSDANAIITGTNRHKWFTLNLGTQELQEFGEDIPNNYYIRGAVSVGDKYYGYFYGNPWYNEFFTTPAINPGSSYNILNNSTPYNVTQLAYDEVNNKMYGYSSQEGLLKEIDMTTGYFIASHSFRTYQGVCSDGHGNVYMMYEGALNRLNFENGTADEILNTGFTQYTSTKMTLIYDDVNEVFYWACYNKDANNNNAEVEDIWRLDPNNGTSEILFRLQGRLYDFVDIYVEDMPSSNGTSSIVWSNCLDKDMFTTLEVTASTNSGDSPAGTSVSFVNISEPEMAISYEVELDETGMYAWDEVRKGTYVYSISLDGYTSCALGDTIEIWDATSIVCEMNEIIASVGDLYVSPTGWAMWESKGNAPTPGGSGDEFTVDFEGGMPSGWTLIDADGDGDIWTYDDGTLGGPAHAGTGYVTSASYSNSLGVLYPDNYIVSPQVNLGGSSVLTFYVSAQDAAYAGEHYGVAISTNGNTNASDFTTIWEETLTAKNASAPYLGPRGTRAVGTWYQKTVDLSEYEGQQVYIAVRHFNTSDMFRINMDDVVLANASKGTNSVENFKVLLDGDFVANVETNYYQHDVTNLIDGEEYTTSVAAVYSAGMSEWSEYTWIYAPCDNYDGVTDFTAENTEENVVLNWTMPNGGPTPPPSGGDTFTESFDSGLNGWTNIDADGDGEVFYHSTECESLHCVLTIDSHSGAGHLCSESYCNCTGALNPNNFLVSPQMYSIVNGSTFSFYACAQDAAYPSEHFGVAVSTTGNTNAADFTTIQEWTLTAKNGRNINAGATRNGGNRATGNWYQFTADLSAYAGQEVWISIRHFNVSDQFLVCIDDLELTTGNKAGRAILFDQSEMITHAGQGAGGADVSAICGESSGAVNYGPNVNWAYGSGEYYLLADDFVLDAATTINSMEFFGYQTGSGNNSTMTGLYIQIYDGSPMNGGQVIWGDNATNLLTSTSFTNIYRVSLAYGGLTNTDRPIMSLVADNLDIQLEAGTYWVQVGFIGSSSSGPWGAPRCIWDESESGNGLQKTDTGWQTWVDGGQKGLPMVISGESGPTPPTPVGGILGAMVFRNGELLTPAPISETTYTDTPEPGDYEYCVRVVYGEEEYENGWYAMSCPVCATVSTACVAPEELSGTYTFNNDGTYGATITWVGNDIPTLDHFNVYRSTTNGNYMLLAEVPASQTSYFDDCTDYPDEYYYKVSAYYVNGEQTCESGFAISATNPDDDYIIVNVTDIEENSISNVSIYPNPTNDKLNINAESMTRITVTTVLGQVVYDQEVESDNEILDMSQYGAGVYMIRIITENGSTLKRVTVIE